jgi:hypothetical protein
LGIRFYPDGYDEHLPFPCVLEDGFPIEWNPLIDDGDALRLAVRLKMEIIPDPEGDEFASTRRTIVRAAAEVGRGIIQQTIDGLPDDNYYKTHAEAKKIGKGGSMSLPALPLIKYDDHPTFNQDGIGWSQEEIEAINKYAALAVAAALREAAAPALQIKGRTCVTCGHMKVWDVEQSAVPRAPDDCVPNHFCNGLMIHLPNDEVCSKCGGGES